MPKRRVARPRVRVWVGAEGKPKTVEGFSFLPGLIAHTSPSKTRKEQLFNITLKRCGYAVVTKVPRDKLEEVKSVLSRVRWFVPLSRIAESDEHFAVAMEGQKVAWEKKSDRYHEKQEARIAEELGGNTQPGSGSRWGYRRDVISKTCQVEAKWTDNDFYSLVLKDWEFLRKQALTADRVPVYVIEIRPRALSVVLVEENHLHEPIPAEDIVYTFENPRTKKSFRVTHEHAELVAKEKTIKVVWGSGKSKRTAYITSMRRLLEGTRSE